MAVGALILGCCLVCFRSVCALRYTIVLVLSPPTFNFRRSCLLSWHLSSTGFLGVCFQQFSLLYIVVSLNAPDTHFDEFFFVLFS